MCVAVTHGHGNPAPCGQEPQSNEKLCYYHKKMEQGHIDPIAEPTTATTIIVKRSDTGATIGKGSPKSRRKK
jgi:hypothetical protein